MRFYRGRELLPRQGNSEGMFLRQTEFVDMAGGDRCRLGTRSVFVDDLG